MVGDDAGKVKRKDGNLAWKVERWNTVRQWKQITVTNSVTFVIINYHVAVCTSGSSTGNISGAHTSSSFSHPLYRGGTSGG